MKNYLEFEREIKALEDKMQELKSPFGSEGISEVDTKKIQQTQNEINDKLKIIYGGLNSWQKTLVARHEDRPKAKFYINKIFTKFTLLSGDRFFGDDKKKIRRRRITGLKTCAFRDFRLFSPRCAMHILNILIRARAKSKRPRHNDNNDILKNCNVASPVKFYVYADGAPVY